VHLLLSLHDIFLCLFAGFYSAIVGQMAVLVVGDDVT
jgi:hypothetical protein